MIDTHWNRSMRYANLRIGKWYVVCRYHRGGGLWIFGYPRGYCESNTSIIRFGKGRP